MLLAGALFRGILSGFSSQFQTLQAFTYCYCWASMEPLHAPWGSWTASSILKLCCFCYIWDSAFVSAALWMCSFLSLALKQPQHQATPLSECSGCLCEPCLGACVGSGRSLNREGFGGASGLLCTLCDSWAVSFFVVALVFGKEDLGSSVFLLRFGCYPSSPLPPLVRVILRVL